MSPFIVISRRSTPEIILSRKKILFSSKLCKHGGKLDYSRYSQVSLLTLCYHWQTLDCQRSLSAKLYILLIRQKLIVQIDFLIDVIIELFFSYFFR